MKGEQESERKGEGKARRASKPGGTTVSFLLRGSTYKQGQCSCLSFSEGILLIHKPTGGQCVTLICQPLESLSNAVA